MRFTIREIRGVTDIGRKSASSLGLDTLGTGVIIALFQRLGGEIYTVSETWRLSVHCIFIPHEKTFLAVHDLLS